MSETLNGAQPQPVGQSIEQNNTSNATNVNQPKSTSASETRIKTPGFELISGIIGLFAVLLLKKR